jgi:Fic family protein
MRRIFDREICNPYSDDRPIDVWEMPSFPNFEWDENRVAAPLNIFFDENNLFLERLGIYDIDLLDRIDLRQKLDEVKNSDKIEGGSSLSRLELFHAIASRLGIPDDRVPLDSPPERTGLVNVIMDAYGNYMAPLDEARLVKWLGWLFPDGLGDNRNEIVGYRRDMIYVVRDDADSDPLDPNLYRDGRREILYTAPLPEMVPDMMGKFLEWFNAPSCEDMTPLPIKAALAHLWFVMIHPFGDGNGRVARALGAMLMARHNRNANCLYSISEQFEADRDNYYNIINLRQNGGGMDVTEWIVYFLGCCRKAIESSNMTCDWLERQAKGMCSVNEFAGSRLTGDIHVRNMFEMQRV